MLDSEQKKEAPGPARRLEGMLYLRLWSMRYHRTDDVTVGKGISAAGWASRDCSGSKPTRLNAIHGEVFKPSGLRWICRNYDRILHCDCRVYGTLIGLTLRLVSGIGQVYEFRHRHRCKDADDHDHHDQFDQREAAIVMGEFIKHISLFR